MSQAKRGLRTAVAQFAPARKVHLPLSFITAALSGACTVVPYYLVWLILRHLIVGGGDNMPSVMTLAIWIVVSQVAAIVFNLLSLMSSHLLAFRVETGMREKSLAHALTLPIHYFEERESGRLRKIIDDNATLTHGFIAHQLPDFVQNIITASALVIFIFLFDIRLGIINLLSIVLAFLMIGHMFKAGGDFMKKYMDALETLNAEGVEYVRGMPVVKVFNQSLKSFKRFYEAIKQYDRFATDYVMSCRPHMIFSIFFLYMPAIIIGPICLYFIDRQAEPAVFFVNAVFYIFLSLMANGQVMKVATMGEKFTQMKLALNKIWEIIDEEPMQQLAVPDTSKREAEADGDIAFHDVTFAYEPDAAPAIRDLSFVFRKNRRYALIGESGSGKSTLVKLIARFYDVSEGAITIGGTDIRNVDPGAHLCRIGMVFQSNQLFKGTLRENVTMGKDFSDEAVLDALEKSSALDILEKVPGGLDGLIGSQGVYLSGGEVQRIGIARVFLHDPPILLFDEATAFADAENEAAIYAAFDKLGEGRTTILIAHRLNVVAEVDEVLLLADGALVDHGTHGELLSRCTAYQDMFSAYKESMDWRL